MRQVTLKELKARRKRRGQSLAEFALVLPILMFMVMGIIDFARALFTYAQASNQLRQALRMASVVGYTSPTYLECQGMRSTAQAVFFAEPLPTVQIWYHPASSYSGGSYTTTLPSGGNCTTTASSPFSGSTSLRNGDILKMSVTAQVRMIAPYFPQILTFTISGQRTIVKDISLVNADYVELGVPTQYQTALATAYQIQQTEVANAYGSATAQMAGPPNDLTQTAIATQLAQTLTAIANNYQGTANVLVGTIVAGATQSAVATSTGWQTETAVWIQQQTQNAIANATNTQNAYNAEGTAMQETANALGVTLTPSNTPSPTLTPSTTPTPSDTPTFTPTPTLSKVTGLVKWTTGSKCSGATADQFIGLTWNKVLGEGIEGYYIYADGVLVGKTRTTDNSVNRCGLSVSKNVNGGTSGCFNLNPSFWDADTTFTYTVAAFNANGAVVGPQSDGLTEPC